MQTPWDSVTLTWEEFHINGLVQERRNSSALAMELRLSCINPSTSDAQEINSLGKFENYSFKITATFPIEQWVKLLYHVFMVNIRYTISGHNSCFT